MTFGPVPFSVEFEGEDFKPASEILRVDSTDIPEDSQRVGEIILVARTGEHEGVYVGKTSQGEEGETPPTRNYEVLFLGELKPSETETISPDDDEDGEDIPLGEEVSRRAVTDADGNTFVEVELDDGSILTIPLADIKDGDKPLNELISQVDEDGEIRVSSAPPPDCFVGHPIAYVSQSLGDDAEREQGSLEDLLTINEGSLITNIPQNRCKRIQYLKYDDGGDGSTFDIPAIENELETIYDEVREILPGSPIRQAINLEDEDVILFEVSFLDSIPQKHASFIRQAHVHEHLGYGLGELEFKQGPALAHVFSDTGIPQDIDEEREYPENKLQLRQDVEFEDAKGGNGPGRIAIDIRRQVLTDNKRLHPYNQTILSGSQDPPIQFGWMEWTSVPMEAPVAPEGKSGNQPDREKFQNNPGAETPVLRPAIVLSVEGDPIIEIPPEEEDEDGVGQPLDPCDVGDNEQEEDEKNNRPKKEERPEFDGEDWKEQLRRLRGEKSFRCPIGEELDAGLARDDDAKDDDDTWDVPPPPFDEIYGSYRHKQYRRRSDGTIVGPEEIIQPDGQRPNESRAGLPANERPPVGWIGFDLLDRPLGEDLTLDGYGRHFARKNTRATNGDISWGTIGKGTEGFNYNISPNGLKETVAYLWKKVGFHARMMDAFFIGNTYDNYGGAVSAVQGNKFKKAKEFYSPHSFALKHWNHSISINYPMIEFVSDIRTTSEKDKELGDAGDTLNANSPIVRIERVSAGTNIDDRRPGIRFLDNNDPNTTDNWNWIETSDGNFTLGRSGDVTLSAGATVNEFSTDGTLADNSDTAVPTEKAVKTYVDANALWTDQGSYIEVTSGDHVRINDDEELQLGSSRDGWFKHNSAAGRLELTATNGQAVHIESDGGDGTIRLLSDGDVLVNAPNDIDFNITETSVLKVASSVITASQDIDIGGNRLLGTDGLIKLSAFSPLQVYAATNQALDIIANGKDSALDGGTGIYIGSNDNRILYSVDGAGRHIFKDTLRVASNLDIEVGSAGLISDSTTQFNIISESTHVLRLYTDSAEEMIRLTDQAGIVLESDTDIDLLAARANVHLGNSQDGGYIIATNGEELNLHGDAGSNTIALNADRTIDIVAASGGTNGTINLQVGPTVFAAVKSSGLALDRGVPIKEFSTDGTLADNSDDTVPTEKAVKTYVDNNAGGYSMGWGGDLTIAGRWVRNWGSASGGDSTVQSRYVAVAPKAGTAEAIGIHQQSGGGSTDWKFWEDGGVVQTLSNIGSGGQLETFSETIAAGSEYSWEFDGGTDPDNTTIVMFISV